MNGPKGKNTGTNTSSVEVSPERRKRDALKRRAQERRWASKSGPVVVTNVSDRSKS